VTTTALEDRLSGTLLGTALGDALGLPAEGMSARAIARRFGRLDRFRLLGGIGFVSDDTEQSALVAQSLLRQPDDAEACARAFSRSLLGWFLRLPWGIGLGTLRASARIALGFRRTGVASAGNGAAMQAAIVGAFFAEDEPSRTRFGRLLAEVTHTDPRAVEAALFVAELAAAASRSQDGVREAVFAAARAAVLEARLAAALDRVSRLIASGADTAEAARDLGTSGFVLHTVPFAAYVFLRHGADPLAAIQESIAAGGDTDSIAAIVGAWVGALHGRSELPQGLIDRIHDGPFGPSHLVALAAALARLRAGQATSVPGYSWPAALARNLALYPVVLAHGLRRLFPD
jgi:ADP-ribosylglycohydrolase